MNFVPFLETYAKTKQCSDQTIRAYSSDLTLFGEFLKARSITRIAQVDHTVISAYIDHMREKENGRFGKVGLSDATIRRRLAAISSYLEYVRATTRHDLRNPVKDFPKKWKRNNQPKPVDEKIIDELLAQITSPRDHVLVVLFLASGLRISEMQQLDRDSIILSKMSGSGRKTDYLGKGEVIGKGNKRRDFYVDKNSAIEFAKYLLTRTDDHPALFLSERKQRMSVRAMQERMNYWCKMAAVEHINIHRLRHTYATRLANANINSLVLKELMGHSSFTTTQQYFKLTDTTLARGYFSAMEFWKK